MWLHDHRGGGRKHGDVIQRRDTPRFQGLGYTDAVMGMAGILDSGRAVSAMNPRHARQMRPAMLSCMRMGMEQGRHALQQDEEQEKGVAEQHW